MQRRMGGEGVRLCHSLQQPKREDFENEGEKKISSQGRHSCGRKRKGEAGNGVSKECRRCYLDTVEEGYQAEVQKKKVGEEDEGSEERRVRNEIIKEVI